MKRRGWRDLSEQGRVSVFPVLPVIPQPGFERRWFYSFRGWRDPGGQGRVSGFPLYRLSRGPVRKKMV
ncbi:TPA: hypothetical protein ACXHWU_003680 [Morganella morganii]